MKRILFVDDEKNVLDGLKRMLRPMRQEWDMSFATGAEEALTILAEGRFEVVVSDMRMPGMDGAQLLTEVKRRHPNIVRIVLSGQSENEMVLRSVGPAHQYLAKPCDPDQLRDVIVRACALRDLLGEDSLRVLVSQMSTIPSLPAIYTEIMEELQSPDASIGNVGRIVAKDVGMTAKILQLVNSAFFGLRRHVADPVQAASFLGVDTLKSLVLSAHIFDQLDNVRIEGFCLESLWNHSVITGALAKRIAAAEDCDQEMRDHALVAGLLHDAGKLVLATNRPKRYGAALASVETDGIELWDAERRVMKNSHAEVGAYLFGLWGLPDPIIEAVAFHHRPQACPGTVFTPLTAVHAANAIAHEGESAWDSQKATNLDEEYLAQLGLTARVQPWRELHTEIAQEGAAK